MHSQGTNGAEGVEQREVASACDQVVDATVTDDLRSFSKGLLQALVARKVASENVHVGAIAELCCNLLLGCAFVADETYDEVVWVLRCLSDELELHNHQRVL